MRRSRGVRPSLLLHPFPDVGEVEPHGVTGSPSPPPTTVSALWGTADETAAAEVRTAHERAVAASLGFLQDHAAFTRTGAGGVLQVDSVAAARAMAEIDHPRLDEAVASTSSLFENMAGGSSRWLAGTISVGESPTGLVDPSIGPTTRSQGWGISVIVSGEVQRSAARRAARSRATWRRRRNR